MRHRRSSALVPGALLAIAAGWTILSYRSFPVLPWSLFPWSSRASGSAHTTIQSRAGAVAEELAVAVDIGQGAQNEIHMRLDRAGIKDVPASFVDKCLDAAKGDVENAYVQLLTIMRWRKSLKVDQVLDNVQAAANELWYRKLLRYDIRYADKKGRAVIIERIGEWDMDAIEAASAKERERMLRSHIFVCEKLLRHSQEQASMRGSDRAPGFVAVLDLAGISAAQNPLVYPNILKALREISGVNARYYPAAAEHLFIVNAPAVFKFIWRTLAPFVTSDDGVQVHILRKGANEPLLQEVGGHVLPAELGGFCNPA